MSLSDLFCVERHKKHFLELVRNKLDIVFANEKEILSLIGWIVSFVSLIVFMPEAGKYLRPLFESQALSDCQQPSKLNWEINSNTARASMKI